MKTRSAIKPDLFAADHRKEKVDRLGDPLGHLEKPLIMRKWGY